MIVLDLDSPKASGWSILRDLRREPATRDLPVIGLTRHAGDREREDARAPCVDLREKPCEPDALYREIKTALGGGRH